MKTYPAERCAAGPSRNARSASNVWAAALTTTLAASILLVTGCASPGDVQPFEKSPVRADITEQEERLWHRAKEIDAAIEVSDQLYDDPALQDYLQQVMDRLFPEFNGTIRVRVLKSPALNAFALPNGSIYINVGLLARLDNEAQLATVLGHEAVHFVNKHGLRQRRQVKSARVVAIGVALTGLPMVGDLISNSSIYGYSRDLEREADAVAHRHLRSAGYDLSQSVAVFRHLAAEARALDEKHPVFFSSHPSLQERINSFRELIGDSQETGRRRDGKEYLRLTASARLDSLRSDLSMSRHRSMLLQLQPETAASRFESHVRYYYLGEAYRQRGEQGDAARAESSFRQAIAASAEYAPSYRALGIQLLKQGEHEEAQRLLRSYVELAPAAPDRAHIMALIDSLPHQGKTQ